jgi:glycosyltransferase involved in cell wall biosynthesis
VRAPLYVRRMALRTLLIMRPDAETRFGGDTVLVRDTAAALISAGLQADVVHTDEPDARGYDIAHVFNVGQPEICARQIAACEKVRVPIALSPVWLDLEEYTGRGVAQHHLFERMRDAARLERQLRAWRRRSAASFLSLRDRIRLARSRAAQADLLRRAHVLLPNSTIEARDCLVRLGVRETPFVVVPIAADLTPALYWQDSREGVLCVGRLEARKNQTATLLGLRASPLPITVVGAAHDPWPFDAVSAWSKNSRFLGAVDRETLLRLYGQCEIHVLASWVETAGIASLEAAAAGAKIVVGDRGAEPEYFEDDAEYADPADPESIAAAVERSRARPARVRGDSLDQRIGRLSAQRSARATQQGYDVAIKRFAATP